MDIYTTPPSTLDELMREREDLSARQKERERLTSVGSSSGRVEASRGNSGKPKPVNIDDRSRNPLRPTSFDTMVGQGRAVDLLRRVVATAMRRVEPLDHVLLVGPSGTGKSTLALVLANELDVDCYQVAAPVAFDVLLQLREVMADRDILFVDEIHLQAIQERRGKDSITQPEVFFNVLEDRTITTPNGSLPFPAITMIGATTDEGMLPDPFLNRFPLRPRLDPYSDADLGVMAFYNAKQLGREISVEACTMFASAARGVPRQINNYVKNAVSLADGLIDSRVSEEVLFILNGVTSDGLTPDQQAMMTFLFQRGKRTNKAGEVTYQASVSTIATGIGKSRDQKAIQLRVEPFLIEKGYVQVGHGGRILTDAGIQRAEELHERAV